MVIGCVFCVRCAKSKGRVSRGETKVAVEHGLHVASDVGVFSFCGYYVLVECVNVGLCSFYG